MDEFRLTGSPAGLGAQFAAQVVESGRTLADVAPESLDPSPAVRAYVRDCEPHVAEHAPGIPVEIDAIADEAGVERRGSGPWRSRPTTTCGPCWATPTPASRGGWTRRATPE